MKAAFVSVGFLLVVLLLWFGAGFFSSEDSAGASPLSSGTSADARPLDPLVAEAGEVRRETNAAAPEAASPSTEQPAQSAAPKAERSAPTPLPDDLRLRVLDGTTREPLDGIELSVFWLAETASSRGAEWIVFEKIAGPERELRIARARVEERRQQSGGAGVVLVRVGGLFAEPIEKRVKTEPWPTAVQELVLPPTGWLEIEVQDELGRTLEQDGRAIVRSTGEHRWSSSQTFEVERGLTAKCICGVDVSLEATGELADGSKLGPSRMRGPLVPGETRREALRRVQLGSKLAIRVRLPSGEPLCSKLVDIRVNVERKLGNASTSFQSGSRETTDAEGWLRSLIPEPQGGEGLRRSYEFYHRHAEQGLLFASLEVNDAFAPGETSLGDVLLQAPQLLASGVVVQRGGQALQGVRVSAQLLDAAGEELRSENLTVETDAEGRFLLRSRRPAPRARLLAHHKSYVEQTPLEVECGASDLVIELDAAASLRGSVVLPRGMDPRGISVLIEGLTGPHGEVPQGKVDVDGTFLVQGIAPLIGTAVLSLQGSGELVRIPELRFLSGEENRDPRLQKLELCSDWRELALRLLRPEGRVFDGCRFELTADSLQWRRRMSTDAEGLASTWLPPEAVHFELRVEGYRTLKFDWASQRLELQLREGIRVLMPVEAPKVEPITRLQMALQKRDGTRSAQVEVLDGLAELVVPEPGSYQIMPGFVIEQGGGMVGTNFLLDPPVEVEIGEGDQQRLPVCRIDEATLRAALKAR
ncbi:MAG: hypothetical protein JNM84_11045 [Planctomycetes bacterium]|nr:hypothetical protein [Planctomycetota bacterium]